MSKDDNHVHVHFVGQVTKPGYYKVPSYAALSDMEHACGGWNTWAAPRRFYVIRFPRPEGITDGLKDKRKKQILDARSVPKNQNRYLLHSNDLIYIPAKVAVGR